MADLHLVLVQGGYQVHQKRGRSTQAPLCHHLVTEASTQGVQVSCQGSESNP